MAGFIRQTSSRSQKTSYKNALPGPARVLWCCSMSRFPVLQLHRQAAEALTGSSASRICQAAVFASWGGDALSSWSLSSEPAEFAHSAIRASRLHSKCMLSRSVAISRIASRNILNLCANGGELDILAPSSLFYALPRTIAETCLTPGWQDAVVILIA